jgi:hypothetical protein
MLHEGDVDSLLELYLLLLEKHTYALQCYFNNIFAWLNTFNTGQVQWVGEIISRVAAGDTCQLR